jgi:hypothetical protein
VEDLMTMMEEGSSGIEDVKNLKRLLDEMLDANSES